MNCGYQNSVIHVKIVVIVMSDPGPDGTSIMARSAADTLIEPNRRWVIDGLPMAGLTKLPLLAKPQAIGPETNT